MHLIGVYLLLNRALVVHQVLVAVASLQIHHALQDLTVSSAFQVFVTDGLILSWSLGDKLVACAHVVHSGTHAHLAVIHVRLKVSLTAFDLKGLFAVTLWFFFDIVVLLLFDLFDDLVNLDQLDM